MTPNPLGFDCELTILQAIVCALDRHRNETGRTASAIHLGAAERIALAGELGDLPGDIDGVRIALINRESCLEVV